MKKLALLALLLLVVPLKGTAQEGTVRISPVKAMYTAQPGSTVRTTISLQNPSNKLITVSVIPRDFTASEALDGQPRIIENGTSAYGISNWLADANLDKKLTIPANQTVDYEAVFRVPSGVTPRTYFGTVTFRPEAGDASNAPPIVGSLVFITVGNPATKLAIDNLEFGESDNATKPHGVFSTIINNSSEGLSTPKFKLKITDDTGKTVLELDQDSEGSVLPNSKRKFTFTPTAELPNKLLTVTVTAVDQNGTTADKSMQLNREITEAEPEIKAVDNKAVNPILLGIIAAVLIGLILTSLFVIKRKQKTVISPLPTPVPKIETAEDTNEKHTNQD